MALVGNMIADAFGGNPSVVNYDMFVAVFSMLCLFYLIFTAISDSFTLHPMLPLALDALNVLFFFCAAVAMAAELGTHSCSNSVRSMRLGTGVVSNNRYRATPSPTTLQTARTIPESAAGKRKQ